MTGEWGNFTEGVAQAPSLRLQSLRHTSLRQAVYFFF
ncbi:hypothetical protein PUATCC27989T_01435 [Phytobacter ursingii]|nr:hypothetical protein PUATCC27989T_01435 [Phytobacter ursingii]